MRATLSGLPQEQRPMTVMEHLEELRRVLMISTGTWILATVVAFTINGRVLDLLERPIKNVLGNGQHLARVPIVTSITDPLTIPLKVSALAGLVLALPVVLWQAWSFVAPGLRPAERRLAAPLGASALGLFAAGGGFAYFVMPIGLNFLAGFLGSNATFLPDLNAYLSFFTLLIVVFGLTFELPIAVILLGLLGVVSSRWLSARRKGIWTVIILVALVVTPGADPFTPTALFVPLILLFEASILVLDRVLHR